MDQGTIVALVALAGSFLTVLVTGAVSIWSKWIESEQKVKEHQLSLRSVYVNKKIASGEIIVSKNNVHIQAFESSRQYLYHIIEDKEAVESYSKLAALGFENSEKNYLDTNDFTSLYFFDNSIERKLGECIDNYNHKIALVVPFLEEENFFLNEDELIPEFEQHAKAALESIGEVINAYKKQNAYVRDELSKYDIV